MLLETHTPVKYCRSLQYTVLFAYANAEIKTCGIMHMSNIKAVYNTSIKMILRKTQTIIDQTVAA